MTLSHTQRKAALEAFKKRYPHYPEVMRDDQILRHDVFKTFCNGWEVATEAALTKAESILYELVPKCSSCEEPGYWNWSDEDGQEWCCDKHKFEHFYAYGPEKDDVAHKAIEFLKDIAKEPQASDEGDQP